MFGSGGFGMGSLGGGDFWGGGESNFLPSGLVDESPNIASGNSMSRPPPGIGGGFATLNNGSSGDKNAQVDAFLKNLGLDRYSIVFKEHEIDMDALRIMSEFDYSRIGVPLGPRVKIMRAFAEGNF